MANITKVRIKHKNTYVLMLCDKSDWVRLKHYNWHYSGYYIVRKSRKFDNRPTRTSIQFAREVLNCPSGLFPDHINQNKLDNRRCNLRIATKQQNQINQKVRNRGKSGFKGVSYHRPSQLFRSYITVNGKFKSLGYFKSKVEAAKAYDQAALKFHKAFRRLNFEL